MESRDLELLLASCIHDMKNSLSLILNSVDHLAEHTAEMPTGLEHLANLRYEASRLNNDLIHLLGVYRIKERELPVVIDEHEVWETLHTQVLRNELLFKKHGVVCELDCDEEELWFYDQELIGGIINNILVNNVRYTQDKIRISATVKDGFLCIGIEDNGHGYPDNMLLEPGKPQEGMNFRSGSTSLGIYFASRVAALHKRADHRGYISLQNGGALGGGVFTVHIP